MSSLQGGDVFAARPRPASEAWRRPIPGYAGHKTYSWDRLNSDYHGPHERPEPKAFEMHIGTYTGHVPHSWVPPSQLGLTGATGKHQVARSPSIKTLAGAGSLTFKRQIHAMRGYGGHVPRNWAPKVFNRSASLCSSKGDGQGSIRLGTPTAEQRERNRPSFATGDGGMQRSASVPMRLGATPAARFGYMSPREGRIDRRGAQHDEAPANLSPELVAKIDSLFFKINNDRGVELSRDDARKYFKKFAKASAEAMFMEVDENNDEVITLKEFRDFWSQVKESGYSEDDIGVELDELLDGNSWANFDDLRDVLSTSVDIGRMGKR